MTTNSAEDPAMGAAAAIVERLVLEALNGLPSDNNDVNMAGVDAGQN